MLSDEGHWETLRSFTPKLLPYTSTEKLQQVRIVGAYSLTRTPAGCAYTISVCMGCLLC